MSLWPGGRQWRYHVGTASSPVPTMPNVNTVNAKGPAIGRGARGL
jgi:hypothetical protein